MIDGKWISTQYDLKAVECDSPDVTGFICCIERKLYKPVERYPDSKVRGANMGPISGRQDPGGPHVGPVNFAIRVCISSTICMIKFHNYMFSVFVSARVHLFTLQA